MYTYIYICIYMYIERKRERERERERERDRAQDKNYPNSGSHRVGSGRVKTTLLLLQKAADL